MPPPLFQLLSTLLCLVSSYKALIFENDGIHIEFPFVVFIYLFISFMTFAMSCSSHTLIVWNTWKVPLIHT